MWPTSSMSTVRKHFWTVVARGPAAPRRRGSTRFNGCMPAVVISTEVSQSGGTSEPLGRRRGHGTRSSRRTGCGSHGSASWVECTDRPGYAGTMHEDDTLHRFESSEPFTGRIEPLDDHVLIEPVDDETETVRRADHPVQRRLRGDLRDRRRGRRRQPRHRARRQGAVPARRRVRAPAVRPAEAAGQPPRADRPPARLGRRLLRRLVVRVGVGRLGIEARRAGRPSARSSSIQSASRSAAARPSSAASRTSSPNEPRSSTIRPASRPAPRPAAAALSRRSRAPG